MTEHIPAGDGGGDRFLDRGGLDVEEHWVDRMVVVAVAGTVDALTAPALTDAIGAAAAKSPAGMIIDLSKVDFLAAAGMSVLISTNTEVGPHAGFGVVADGPATSRPLTLIGIDRMLALYRTLDDALEDLSGG